MLLSHCIKVQEIAELRFGFRITNGISAFQTSDALTLYDASINIYITFYFLWRCDPTRVMASSFLRFLDHTQRRATVGRTPLDEWSARRRSLYLTTHNTHNRQTSMPPAAFEPTISAGERPQTYALDRAATGTDKIHYNARLKQILNNPWSCINII
jgi:hypothetical protein